MSGVFMWGIVHPLASGFWLHAGISARPAVAKDTHGAKCADGHASQDVAASNSRRLVCGDNRVSGGVLAHGVRPARLRRNAATGGKDGNED